MSRSTQTIDKETAHIIGYPMHAVSGPSSWCLFDTLLSTRIRVSAGTSCLTEFVRLVDSMEGFSIEPGKDVSRPARIA